MINETSFIIQPRPEMGIKVYIPLSRDAALALRKMADQEHRDPKQQASWIIETELRRHGFLQPETTLQEPNHER